MDLLETLSTPGLATPREIFAEWDLEALVRVPGKSAYSARWVLWNRETCNELSEGVTFQVLRRLMILGDRPRFIEENSAVASVRCSACRRRFSWAAYLDLHLKRRGGVCRVGIKGF